MSHAPDCVCDTCYNEWKQLERLKDWLDEHGWNQESVKAFCRSENVPEDSFTVSCCIMPEFDEERPDDDRTEEERF